MSQRRLSIRPIPQRERPMDANLVSSVLDKIRAMMGQPSNLNGFYVALVVVLLVNKIF